jgi:hypothetical protein
MISAIAGEDTGGGWNDWNYFERMEFCDEFSDSV